MGPDGVNAYAVHALGITGDGVNIGLLSTGNVRSRHAAFARSGGSAVILYDFTNGAGLSWANHDTAIAGVAVSGGSAAYPAQIGVAPGAVIHSGRISGRNLQARYLQNALDTLIKDHHCRIFITGIQLSSPTVTPNGGSWWTQLYDFYADTYDVIFINAAGNYSDQVTIFGDGYNGITTAGLGKDETGRYRRVGRGSNSGPTLDGRRKPDIAAPTDSLRVPSSRGDDLWSVADPNGRGLTSYAIPFTAGAAALLLETAGKTAVDDDDRSEVIKAVIVNSSYTDLLDKSGKSNSSKSIDNWNTDYGYGRLDILRSRQTLTGGRIEPGQSARQQAGWAYGTIPEESEQIYRLTGYEGQRLVTTITWHRKLNRISLAQFMEAPRFYLHLKIVSPGGQSVVFEIPDHNNLIKADHLLTEDGEYQIIVQNPTRVNGRDYGLAFEFVDSMEK